MTRAQLVTRAQLYYNEPSSSSAIATADWQAFADAIYQEMCRDTRCLPDSDTQTITAAQRTYMIPLVMEGIFDKGVLTTTSGPLRGPLDLAELARKDTSWRTTSGVPLSWYYADDVVTNGADTNWGIGLYPVPSATVASGLIICGWSVPAAFSGDSSVPVIPAGWHDVIAWGMAWLAAVKDLDRAGRNAPKLNYMAGEYQRRKKMLKATVKTLGYDAPGQADLEEITQAQEAAQP